MADLIDRQTAIDTAIEAADKWDGGYSSEREGIIRKFFDKVPAVQPDHTADIGKKAEKEDCISRQAAIDALHMHLMYRMGTDRNKKRLDDWINGVPSVQPERTCVNCGRTMNNGGWYADGRTRCPIEEHYALPKDGFCHLWEKRNITDDDYPERRTDG